MAGAPEVPVAGTSEDGRGVAGNPEALVVGTTDGVRLESPEVLAETAEEPPAVTETPEAVDPGIPDGPTSLSGRCGGGRLHGDAGAVSTRGN